MKKSMHLGLTFLGPYQATLNDEPLVESRARRIEALLVYLAVESTHAHRRETLVGLLFPEMPDNQARTNLRQTLTRLRRLIRDQEVTPPFLLTTRETSQFNEGSDYSLDVTTFTKLLNGCEKHLGNREPHCQECLGQSEKAVALYRGPFLEGFSLADSAAFEDWLIAKRERLEQQALSALQELADFQELQGNYPAAEIYVRRQLAINPWLEESHQQLMRLFAFQGRRLTALRQYKILEKFLDEELGVEPLPETRRLFRRIATAGDTRPAVLPVRHPSFIGRKRELGVLNQFMVDPQRRLLTLTGMGGCGKTALAVEAGWQMAARPLGPFFHGVYFIPLAGIAAAKEGRHPLGVTSTLDPIITAFAETLNFSFSGTVQPQEELLRFLEEKSTLLIIDNFEHLMTPGRELIRLILQRSVDLNMIITSRERLGLQEEWVLEISGLPYPLPQEKIEDETLISDSQAVHLFLQRARHLVPGFALSGLGSEKSITCSGPAVLRIVQLMQGLPLGIELAASWIRTLTCAEIAGEIERNLDFLQSTFEDTPARHQNLRVVFDYSWQLLSPEEKHVLSRLSVFRGPFDRRAAASIAGASLPELNGLVDRSLIHRDPSSLPGEDARFELLVVLKQFAAEKMAGLSQVDNLEAVNQRHAAYYLGFLAERLDSLKGRGQQDAVAEIMLELENIRVAWRWAASHGDRAGIEKGLDPLTLLYYMRSWFFEGAEMITLAADNLFKSEVDGSAVTLQGQLLACQGWLTFLSGRQENGLNLLTQSVERLRPTESPQLLAFSLNFLSAATDLHGDHQTALILAREGLATSEASRDLYSLAIANNVLSQITYQLGNYHEAHRYCETSLAIEREIGNRWSMGFSLTNLGRVAYALGNYTKASDYFLESLAIREKLGDARGQALCIRYLGDTTAAVGAFELAKAHYEAALIIEQEIGNETEQAITRERLNQLARTRKEE